MPASVTDEPPSIRRSNFLKRASSFSPASVTFFPSKPRRPPNYRPRRSVRGASSFSPASVTGSPSRNRYCNFS
jgi:hypothetical protein